MRTSKRLLDKIVRYLAIALASCLILSGVFSPSLRDAVAMPPAVPDLVTVKPETDSVDSLGLQALRRGKQFYDAGRFIEAVDRWQVAATEAEQSGDRPNQVRALRYRAMAHQALNQWSVAADFLAEAEAIARGLDPTAESALLQAQLKVTQGNFLLGKGQTQQALATFEQAEELYETIGDRDGRVLSRLNQAQTLQTLGFYPRARNILTELAADLATEPDSRLKGRALRQLSLVLQTVGERDQAAQALADSQTIFETLNIPAELAETAFQQGHMAQSQKQWQAARRFYNLAQTFTDQPNLRLESAVQKIRVARQDPQQLGQVQPWKDAMLLLNQLDRLPPSRWRFYTQVHLAQSLLLPEQTRSAISDSIPIERSQHRFEQQMARPLAKSLAIAATQAHELQDVRAESYLLGQLGNLYEQNRRDADALKLTRKALMLARQLNADDLIATWQWQMGRLLKAEGETTAAIAAYGEAVQQLQDLRQDLVATDPDAQFSFRDQVEPVYQQLVQLLLIDVDDLSADEKQERLERSRQTIEALQLAQVQNFLREACETYETLPIEEMDTTAAVIYPIVLDDRLEVILSMPDQPLQHYGSDLPEKEQLDLYRNLRQALNPAFPAELGLKPAQQLYDYLIRPGEQCLQQQHVETLVFVLDDFLRSLPMAVMHDGDRYLIENYSLALTPGLQLTDSRALNHRQQQLLAGGLKSARQGFSALPGVEQEIRTVSTAFQDQLKTQVLVDQDFSRAQLLEQAQASAFSIVHLATHGQFSSKAEETFLLTWSERLGIKDLDVLLNSRVDAKRSPVELLILSACQTAKGDRRATLGLAGLAVRSGARSTLATLWSVQDQSTAMLIEDFYRQLFQQGKSRAQALRQAQMSMLKGDYAHPYYWAPFVLIGNWQ